MHYTAGMGAVGSFTGARALPDAGFLTTLARLLLDGAGALFGLYLLLAAVLAAYGAASRRRANRHRTGRAGPGDRPVPGRGGRAGRGGGAGRPGRSRRGADPGRAGGVPGRRLPAPRGRLRRDAGPASTLPDVRAGLTVRVAGRPLRPRLTSLSAQDLQVVLVPDADVPAAGWPGSGRR